MKIYCGDSLVVLKTLETGSVDCIVTSPPYFQQRDYGVEGQLGLESTIQEYIDKLCDIFDEGKRVLKKTGTCFVNLGDTYSHTRQRGGLGNWDRPSRTACNAVKKQSQELPAKSLCMIPFRFCIEMANRGWILRNDIIWHKPNAIPNSVKDRFTNDFEHLFFFVQHKKYYFEQQFEPYAEQTFTRMKYGRSDDYKNKDMKEYGGLTSKWKAKPYEPRGGLARDAVNPILTKRKYEVNQVEIASYLKEHIKDKKEFIQKLSVEKDYTYIIDHWLRTDDSGASLPSVDEWWKLKDILGFDDKYDAIMTETIDYISNPNISAPVPIGHKEREGRNKRAVWSISCKSYKGAHFATYPPGLIEPCIKAGCPIGGIVLDPFIGSGTTAVVAKRLERDCIGIELNPDYISLILERLSE